LVTVPCGWQFAKKIKNYAAIDNLFGAMFLMPIFEMQCTPIKRRSFLQAFKKHFKNTIKAGQSGAHDLLPSAGCGHNPKAGAHNAWPITGHGQLWGMANYGAWPSTAHLPLLFTQARQTSILGNVVAEEGLEPPTRGL